MSIPHRGLVQLPRAHRRDARKARHSAHSRLSRIPQTTADPLAASLRSLSRTLRSGLPSARANSDLKPDIVVAHGGRGSPSPFLEDVFACPILNYCEYYFAELRRDISYRIDLPPAEPASFFPRSINAPVLASLASAHGGYSATQWQKESFPKRFWPKIEVHFDGVDADLYRPGPSPRRGRAPARRQVARSEHESRHLRRPRPGVDARFDLFMRVASRIARERSDVLFVVVGQEEIYYGWDKLHTGAPSFKRWVLERVDHDQERFVFLGHVLPEVLAEIFRLSNLHLYMTVPFVLSWSLINALSTGLTVIGSDVPPVREVIERGISGLIEPLFDVDAWVETALRSLGRSRRIRCIGKSRAARVEEKYSLDAAVPALKDYFERMAST